MNRDKEGTTSGCKSNIGCINCRFNPARCTGQCNTLTKAAMDKALEAHKHFGTMTGDANVPHHI
jgi:hypothetical protein